MPHVRNGSADLAMTIDKNQERKGQAMAPDDDLLQRFFDHLEKTLDKQGAKLDKIEENLNEMRRDQMSRSEVMTIVGALQNEVESMKIKDAVRRGQIMTWGAIGGLAVSVLMIAVAAIVRAAASSFVN